MEGSVEWAVRRAKVEIRDLPIFAGLGNDAVHSTDSAAENNAVTGLLLHAPGRLLRKFSSNPHRSLLRGIALTDWVCFQ